LQATDLIQEIQHKLGKDSHVGHFNLSVLYFSQAIVVRGKVRNFHQKQIVSARSLAVLQEAGVKIPFRNEIEVWKPLQLDHCVVKCDIQSEPKGFQNAVDSLSAPPQGEDASDRLAALRVLGNMVCPTEI
jgi:hypothetical protein